MKQKLILLILCCSVYANCPASFPGERPCIQTCGPHKHCSQGLWCCGTHCGGTVCKIPDLNTNPPLPNRRQDRLSRYEQLLTVPSIPREQPAYVPDILQPNVFQDPLLLQSDRLLLQRDPLLLQRDPLLLQRDPLLSQHDPLLLELQADLLPSLQQGLLKDIVPPTTGYNHDLLLGQQHLHNFQSPQSPQRRSFEPQINNDCPPDRPKVFCGHNPCDGKTCPVFHAAVCIPLYCGDCGFKFTLADVDVTGVCHVRL